MNEQKVNNTEEKYTQKLQYKKAELDLKEKYDLKENTRKKDLMTFRAKLNNDSRIMQDKISEKRHKERKEIIIMKKQ